MNTTGVGAKTAEWTLPYALDASTNAFRDKFGHLHPDEWCETLIASMSSPIIEGIEFPHFAPQEIQEQTHGTSGETALREAAAFYKFIASKPFYKKKAVPDASFLDFGAGWGRIARFFIRDFDLSCFFAFEPHRSSCFRARLLNPYLCTLTGGEIPDQSLPANRFDVVVGWSVFSHLSESSAIAWLEELARIVRPDGYCVLSTFGDRFLQHLAQCRDDLRSGKEIHWYYQDCLKAAGDIVQQQKRYLHGDFVWIGNGPTKDYGQATILSEKALLNIVRGHKLPFDCIEFDHKSLNMDVFTLRRR